jgi:ubiquinone/menaquinone biosynthesis C-methylase UbiE
MEQPMRPSTSVDRETDKAYYRYQARRRAFWDRIAREPKRLDLSGYYHRRAAELYRHLVRPNQSVIELGSGRGDLLASVSPRRGVGVDFSAEMVEVARARYPELEFLVDDVHELQVEETFDVVVLSDLINDLWDVQAVLDKVHELCTPESRVFLNFYNKLWQTPLNFARRMGLAIPLLKQNWLSVADVRNLLRLSGFEVVSTTAEMLLPAGIPGLSTFFNKLLVKLWPFNHLALTHVIVARVDTTMEPHWRDQEASVSIVVPARNEAGHIDDIITRTPRMGSRTELIFVEGNSTDDTYAVIQHAVEQAGSPDIRLYRQPGSGKGDAVRHGFANASGEILMILDADMTVAPEELPRFYGAILDGSGEFINGVRLVYPMEHEAMQFLNYLGNKFFGTVFSWILRQPVKDTLCGTKVLTRQAYESIAANRAYFGDFDPFGDFDLLFGAARNHLRIVDVPIRYRERVYGSTNIDRWRHGVLLLKMAGFAARRLRFI